MSGDYIAADPSQMKRKAELFDQQADYLDSDGQSLLSDLQRIGNCWGSDKTGKAFEQQYKQNADALVQSIPHIVENVRDVAKGIRAQATAYDNQNTIKK